ncbi:MAG TPA: hypothetical protein VFG83_10745 [Kofleriaceae bacterium]|nr:hypothetical protein [Kofleriaceae bacterium]
MQLWLTLSMSFLCAALITGLGVWVLSEARVATKVGVTNILGAPCPKPDMSPLFAPAGAPQVAPDKAGEPEIKPPSDDAPEADVPAPEADVPAPEADVPAPEADVPAPEADVPAAEADVPAPTGDAPAAEDSAPVITIDDSSFSTVPALPPGFVEDIVRYRTCRLGLSGQIESLRHGQRLIGWFLLTVGILLTLGITFAGIKMSHHIAGPLYKVTLYLDKIKAGRYDTVYNLRKGDQLVGFYDRFKGAHAGIRGMEADDLARYREVIAAAEAEGANLAARSPELSAALDELRRICARKEKSLDGK